MVMYKIIKNKYLYFRFGLTHLKYSFKMLGKTFNLQNEILKTEMNHDEVYVDTWKDKKNVCFDFVKNDVLRTFFLMLDIVKQWKKLRDLVSKIARHCLVWVGNFITR